ncbi:MAG: DUF4168 domain-containing protein [Sphingomonas sp.]|jgi:hypothetical protein|uniref:DUF4168 domain-containing protein n=1 Tax=Sphingomonas sp. TaxID=28214 RepID=UPI003564FFE1
MAKRTKIFGSIALTIGCAGLGHEASATPPMADGQQPVLAATAFTAEQISDYAAALVELQRIQRNVAKQSAGVPAPQNAQLLAEAKDVMHSAIERHGLDAATFNAISGAVEKDRGLRLRVRQAMMDDLLGT